MHLQEFCKTYSNKISLCLCLALSFLSVVGLISQLKKSGQLQLSVVGNILNIDEVEYMLKLTIGIFVYLPALLLLMILIKKVKLTYLNNKKAHLAYTTWTLSPRLNSGCCAYIKTRNERNKEIS